MDGRCKRKGELGTMNSKKQFYRFTAGIPVVPHLISSFMVSDAMPSFYLTVIIVQRMITGSSRGRHYAELDNYQLINDDTISKLVYGRL